MVLKMIVSIVSESLRQKINDSLEIAPQKRCNVLISPNMLMFFKEELGVSDSVIYSHNLSHGY